MAKTNQGKKPVTQEEYVTNKVLAVFSVCLLGVLVLMVLQRLLGYGSTWATGMLVQKVLLVVGALGVLWGLVLLMQERSGKRQAARRLVCGRHVLIVSIALVLVMTAIGYFDVLPIKGLYILLPVLAVYYLVYHSYSPEFFVIAVDCGVAVGLIWVVRRALASARFGWLAIAAVVLMAVLAAVQLFCVARVRAGQGRLTHGGRRIDLHLSRNAYTMLTVTPVVMAALVLLARVLPSAGLLCMGAAAVYLFLTAVYYTVKLI